MATQTQSTQSPTEALSQAGVSIWLDDLSRERITSGGLAPIAGSARSPSRCRRTSATSSTRSSGRWRR